MGVVTDVTASFEAARETFERIKDQQPSDLYITRILEVLVPIIYTLRYDMENGTHGLVGLLLAEAPYFKKCKAAFPWPTKSQGYTSRPSTRRRKMSSVRRVRLLTKQCRKSGCSIT